MSRSTAIRNIINARSMWTDSLHSRNLYSLLDCYDTENVIFKGTTNNRVTSSKTDLEFYFKKFLKKSPTVTFTQSNITYVNYSFFDTGTYAFHFENGRPIYANYQFVYKMIGDEPKIISHFSSEI